MKGGGGGEVCNGHGGKSWRCTCGERGGGGEERCVTDIPAAGRGASLLMPAMPCEQAVSQARRRFMISRTTLLWMTYNRDVVLCVYKAYQAACVYKAYSMPGLTMLLLWSSSSSSLTKSYF